MEQMMASPTENSTAQHLVADLETPKELEMAAPTEHHLDCSKDSKTEPMKETPMVNSMEPMTGFQKASTMAPTKDFRLERCLEASMACHLGHCLDCSMEPPTATSKETHLATDLACR